MVHFNGSRQGKKKAVKKMKQVDTNHKPIVQLQFNVPKVVADDKLLKNNIYTNHMELSKQELGEIFDIVNSMYIGLKGDKKRITKKACKLWKPDNNLYKFLIALYNSEEINEKIRKPIEEDIAEGRTPCDWETKKVSWKHHYGRMEDLNNTIERLEQDLENIESGKGYIKLEDH
jgi:hypothetical protein